MLRSLQVAQQARREDYESRARAAGVLVLRSLQQDAAAYGDLEALVRRELHQLVLDRSLGRVGGPGLSRLGSILKVISGWEPLIKLIAAILAFATAAIGLYLLFHKRSP